MQAYTYSSQPLLFCRACTSFIQQPAQKDTSEKRKHPEAPQQSVSALFKKDTFEFITLMIEQKCHTPSFRHQEARKPNLRLETLRAQNQPQSCPRPLVSSSRLDVKVQVLRVKHLPL
jgi:hypothetical protein